jgi:hypothetical protein
MTPVTKMSLSILLTVAAIAVEVIATALLVPVVVSPIGAGAGTTDPLLVLVGAGLVAIVASVTLRRQSKAVHQP